MSQWVSLLLIILFNEIRNVEVGMPTEITTLEPYRVRFQVASIFASVGNDKELVVWGMISLGVIEAWIATVVCQ